MITAEQVQAGASMTAKKKSDAPIVTYKGFDKDWKCRDFQYAIGETYIHEGKVVRCTEGGFHSCEMPLDVFRYYKPNAGAKFAIVEVGGKIDRAEKEDSKIASATITIKTELRLPGIIRSAAEWILAAAKTTIAKKAKEHAAATGDCGHAAATGDYGHAAATGYSGHAAATGNSGHAAATGNYGHAAATGDYGTAFAGFNGTAKAGANGAFAIAWYDEKAKRARLIVGTPEEDGIKADTLYKVVNGKLTEVA